MEKLKKIITEISRIILGSLFVLSGFVKAVDPLGSGYKFGEYFTAFGLSWLDPLALPLAFFLITFEFTLGVCILLGIYRKSVTLLTLLLMVFMTALTFYSALNNPVKDCGCFGDAFVLTNWQTFYKNIVFILISVVLFYWHKRISSLYTSRFHLRTLIYTVIFILGVSFYCYSYLPILDFRAYHLGANIPQSMEIPEGAPQTVYETLFILQKDGIQKEFSLDNYPDSTWTFVDSKSKIIKEGYTPKIHDFTITTLEGEEITDIVLSDTSYTFLLIAYKFEKANDTEVDKINEIFDYALSNNYPFYCLTSSTRDEIRKWVRNTGAEYPICTTDETTLKTIIRSNPGLLLLKQGVVYNKWPNKLLPSGEVLEKPLTENKLGQIAANNDRIELLVCSLVLLIPLIIFYLQDIRWRRKTKTH